MFLKEFNSHFHSICRPWASLGPDVCLADRKLRALDFKPNGLFLIIFKLNCIRKKFEVRDRPGEKTHRVEVQGTNFHAFPRDSAPRWFEAKYTIERCRTNDAVLDKNQVS